MCRSSIPVLYIAGTGRSGSTLVANILGALDDAVSVGELRFAWQRGLSDNGYCGCGKPIRQCEFWASVFERAFGGFDRVDAGAMQQMLSSSTRIRHIPRMLRHRNNGKFGRSGTGLLALYEAIHQESDKSVIIDSSKLPTYAQILSEFPQIDLRVLHLVRDPRGAAWSWMRRAPTGGLPEFREHMDRFSPVKSSVLWTVWNTLTRYLFKPGRYMIVRYEDFVEKPEEVLKSIARFADLPDDMISLSKSNVVELPFSHTIAGNPNRMRSGAIRIEPDREWEQSMPRSTQLMIGAIASPVLRKLGYRLWAQW